MTKYIFIVLLTLINFTYSQSRVCNFCSQEIVGRYIQVDNKFFHPEHFKCAKCGNLISGSYTTENGKFYHENCFYQERGLKCATCSKLISGKYYTVNNKNYHPECLDGSKPKCEYCKKPIDGKHFIKDGKNYHSVCYDKFVALKCDVCLEPIKGKYTIDNLGNKYHSYHLSNIPSCDNCGRIISKNTTGGGKRYNDGREICTLCYHNSISGYQSIESIYKNVLSTLSIIGIKIETENIKLIPADRNILRNAAGSSYSNAMKGYCKSERKTTIDGENKTIEDKFRIYLLDGVPREYLAASIAHELMHVWLIQNTKNHQSPLLMEGSCNYTSYLYLRSQNTILSREVINALQHDPDSIYGEGFRKVKNKFSRSSVPQFLNYLKNNSSI